MRWGKSLLIVVVALVGVQVVGLVQPSRATAPSLAPRLYNFDYNHVTQELNTPGVSNNDIGVLAGNVAIGHNVGDVQPGPYTLIGEDFGGGKVLNYLAKESMFTPFGSDWKGGVTVAIGDTDGAAGDEIVVGQATGGSLVRVYSDQNTTVVLASFQAYEDGFTGGVRVAIGDVDGNGTNEIVTVPGPGRAPTMKVFTPTGTPVSSTDVYVSSFVGGVFVATANLDGDVASEIVTGAGAGAGPHVKVFNGTTEAVGFFAFASENAGGVRVAAGVLDTVPVIATTTRTAEGGVIRLFNADGTAASAPTVVTQSDGDLSIAISDNRLHAYDAGPRLIGVDSSQSQVRRHTRNVIKLYGAALSETFENISMGDEAHPAFVTAVFPDGNNLEVAFAVPADAESGVLPLTLSVTTPRGTATHNLQFNGLSIISTGELQAVVTTGVGSGGGPHVRTYGDGALHDGFMAGEGDETSGVRIARADFDGEGTDEHVVSYGPGQFPDVYIVNNAMQPISGFEAYDESFLGGLFVAAGDVDPTIDGPEIVTAADAGGGPHVKIFTPDGEEIGGFMAYGANFHGGVRVAVGDVDGDGYSEIITAPGSGGGPHVRAFTPDGQEVGGFMAYGPEFTGGVYVAAADVDGDGVDEVITGPGAGGGPHVRAFTRTGTEVGGFMAFAPNFTGGVTVARVGDDIIGPNLIAVGAGPGGGPHVRIFDPDGTEVDRFMAYDPKFTGGVFVAGGLTL